jgi:hypothetical protein
MIESSTISNDASYEGSDVIGETLSCPYTLEMVSRMGVQDLEETLLKSLYESYSRQSSLPVSYEFDRYLRDLRNATVHSRYFDRDRESTAYLALVTLSELPRKGRCVPERIPFTSFKEPLERLGVDVEATAEKLLLERPDLSFPLRDAVKSINKLLESDKIESRISIDAFSDPETPHRRIARILVRLESQLDFEEEMGIWDSLSESIDHIVPSGVRREIIVSIEP